MGNKKEKEGLRDNFNSFWQAFIIVILIFGIGFFLGFQLENFRNSKIEEFYLNSELSLLDSKIMGDSFSFLEVDCELATEANRDFSNRIYEEYKVLGQYEDANKLTEQIKREHRKYDLLRTLFWLNLIKMKNTCGSDYDIVTYIYKYENPSFETNAKQDALAFFLNEIRKSSNYNLELVALAGDNGLSSINYLLKKNNISQEDLPVILINEETKVTEVSGPEDITKYLNRID